MAHDTTNALLIEARDLLRSRRRLKQCHFEAVHAASDIPAAARAEMLGSALELVEAAHHAGRRLSEWDRRLLGLAPSDNATLATVADWIGLSQGGAGKARDRGRLVAGDQPGRYRLRESVRAYCGELRERSAALGDGNLRQLQEQTHPDWADTEDPDAMPVDQRLKYWQAVRQRQAAQEHVAELAEEFAAEYHRQAGEAMRTIREAIEAAGLSDVQLDAIRAAVTRAEKAN